VEIALLHIQSFNFALLINLMPKVNCSSFSKARKQQEGSVRKLVLINSI